ncbi:lysozyme inhibitor LprI family protein [Novosphingobium terrae]|uniref:lysozyme inhibitor LprI family protein n=1 Tax=Novosphingobium terrae TaxID=2726189 RepID=UPI001F13E134|nr:lysozyme inhibitor LprI family protein [Novosphingobium terrae]
MPRPKIILLALAIATMPAAALTQISSGNWDAVDAKVRAVCHRLGQPKPPIADLPSAAQIKALKGCDAEKTYYGEGIKVDYLKARQCAFAQIQNKDDASTFGGETILMQLYANGFGVKRDPDLATAYACQIDGSPMENESRVQHLQSLKSKPGPFDYCDDIGSGLAQGECQARRSNQKAAGRDSRLAALIAGFPAASRPLYTAMKQRFDAFVDAHGGGEVDLTGTARAALVIEEQDRVQNQFLKDLDRLKSGQWPAASANDAAMADAQLNTSYRKAMVWAGSKNNFTTTRPDDIRKTQRAWLTYRDAYLRFATLAAPGLAREAVLTRLTRLRTAQLDDLSAT